MSPEGGGCRVTEMLHSSEKPTSPSLTPQNVTVLFFIFLTVLHFSGKTAAYRVTLFSTSVYFYTLAWSFLKWTGPLDVLWGESLLGTVHPSHCTGGTVLMNSNDFMMAGGNERVERCTAGMKEV